MVIEMKFMKTIYRCYQPSCLLELSKDCEIWPGQEVIRLNEAGQLGLGERCIMPKQDGGNAKKKVCFEALIERDTKSLLKLDQCLSGTLK